MPTNNIPASSANDTINSLIIKGATQFTHYDLKSVYSHENRFNNDTNTYKMNCSGFVHLVLTSQKIEDPIKEVLDFVGNDFQPSILNDKPSPLHYVFFLQNKNNKKYWTSMNDASLLTPGDFIAYTKTRSLIEDPKKLYSNVNQNELNSECGQHIMIVADTPKQDYTKSHLLWVPIFDSTKSNHGYNDARSEHNNGGFGRGTIGLMLDKHNKPISLIWKNHSHDPTWTPKNQDLLDRNIEIARINKSTRNRVSY